jgi:radical SAM superfamily enzyme YgiQ (UPF0313 family)
LQAELNRWLTNQGISQEYFNDVFYENTPTFSQDQIALLKEFIARELTRLEVDTFDYIACSLFSFLAQQFGRVFLTMLRPATHAKIIIGGAGLTNFKNTLGCTNALTFPEELKEAGVIDEYITGEAENALVDYFTLGHGHGIGNGNFKQIEELDPCPWPDYSYYNLNDYPGRQLTIIGSRGCVRNCTFCDVAKTSPKYKYRSGKSIADEIIHHYETHGVTNYYFADSLVNGSFKAFDEMCNGLANYTFAEPITWSGQYIIRSERTTPKNHFDMLKASGCKTLFVGIESGCDRVRAELGKKFANDDIEYYLENFSQKDIEVLFLFFTGYVSETEQDHAETLQMFKRWQRFVADGTIQGIETLNILSILPGAPLEQYAKDNNFLFLHDETGALNLRSWVNPAMPEYDFKERVRRHVGMVEEAMKYRWPLWNGCLSMDLYEQSLTRFLNSPRKYIPIMAS